MESWEEYNTKEDLVCADLYLVKLLSGLQPNDPKIQQYKNECQIQIFVHNVESLLRCFEFNKKHVAQFFKNSNSINLQYCKLRYHQNTSILLKWHYCLALYFIEKGNWIKEAIQLILQSSRLNDHMISSFYLTLAFNLNKLYNCGFDKEINQIAIDFLMQEQDSEFLDAYVRIVSELEPSREVKNKLLDNILKLSEKQKFPIFEKFLKSAIMMAQDKKPICEKLARRYEELGDKEQESLEKINHYKNAQDYFENLDDTQRITKKITTASKDVSFREISHTFEISKIKISGENNYQRLMYLLEVFRYNIPKINTVKQQTEEHQKKFSLSGMFPRINIGDVGIPTSYSNSQEEINQTDYINNYTQHIRYMDLVISYGVNDYELNNKITVEDYVDFLKSFGLHSKSVLSLIEQGVKRHYENDYISSIHILIPQIEHTLRNLLDSKGVSIQKLNRDIAQYVTLHDLIDHSLQILGDDIAEYLKLKFVKIDSINLRNRVCHSLYHEFDNLENYDALHEFSHDKSLSLILIIMMLTRLSLTEP